MQLIHISIQHCFSSGKLLSHVNAVFLKAEFWSLLMGLPKIVDNKWNIDTTTLVLFPLRSKRFAKQFGAITSPLIKTEMLLVVPAHDSQKTREEKDTKPAYQKA